MDAESQIDELERSSGMIETAMTLKERYEAVRERIAARGGGLDRINMS